MSDSDLIEITLTGADLMESVSPNIIRIEKSDVPPQHKKAKKIHTYSPENIAFHYKHERWRYLNGELIAYFQYGPFVEEGLSRISAAWYNPDLY